MILRSIAIVAASHGSIRLSSNVNVTTPRSSSSTSSLQLFLPLTMKQTSMPPLFYFLFDLSRGLPDFSDFPVIVKAIVYVPNFSTSLEVNTNFPVSATKADLVVPSV